MSTTPNFRMIRLAREEEGLTQAELARRSAIPQSKLSRIESGHTQASGEEIDTLATALGLPASFLLEPGVPAAVPLFRRKAIRSARRMASLQARLNLAVLIVQRLLAAGVEIDPPQVFPEPGQFDPAKPIEAATVLRRDWRLPVGPIDNVTRVIEAAGGVVLRVDFGGSDATAAFVSVPTDSRMWFLVNTREEAGDRVRLSLAHELGHAVLHRMLPGADEAEMELQAFEFAAALLLPPSDFDKLVPYDALTLSDARHLKRVFGVSVQMIVRTAHLRNRISRARYTSLYKQLSARQWRTVEPDAIPLERPAIWPEVLRIHRQVHKYTDFDLAELSKVTVERLARIFPEEFTFRPMLRAVESPRIASSMSTQ